MAIVVEDGTGLANAESYVSVADADAHFAARGYSNWATMSETEKENALRRAADYMAATYGPRWAGLRVGTTQALDWPRQDVPRRDVPEDVCWPTDEVPAIVVKAQCELAYRAAHGELAPDMTAKSLVKKEKVDVIEKEYDNARSPRYTIYRAVGNLLSPLFRTAGGAYR